ncbi:phosphoribosylformylglycinamidine cyclo-ligase, chloroplastic [Zea mays]|uniref:phosphoribosylformylglycinamidine cyclo-ligase, chloroplastic n=1 Tax=Zea mays TaxID=4577 RepID=UPI0009AAC9DF|nr:phosphoribosylformylglycinamidine cyclo-ligase, chloroplastic [Zea mays]|eukprot:XP_020404807.1 phosphoribosylformylglycinamidine cyclo-ligase, chloroplastic [Zea mays]
MGRRGKSPPFFSNLAILIYLAAPAPYPLLPFLALGAQDIKRREEALKNDDDYLVASTDGVGTKLKLAFETGIQDTIGIDLVAMSVNDIVTLGAKPLFFLDYYATSKLDVDLAEKVIKVIRDGCEQSDCALLGGETAEMPGFYVEGEYDLSGFAVGVVKKDKIIDGKNIVKGDVLIGLPSSGVHSNGFSLVRRVLEKSGLSLDDQLPRNDGITTTVGEALMAPTFIYVKQVLEIISKGGVKGLAHTLKGMYLCSFIRAQ